MEVETAPERSVPAAAAAALPPMFQADGQAPEGAYVGSYLLRCDHGTLTSVLEPNVMHESTLDLGRFQKLLINLERLDNLECVKYNSILFFGFTQYLARHRSLLRQDAGERLRHRWC